MEDSRPADTTWWTMIRGAASGRAEDREEFARRYGPVIRAYLAARWRTTPHQQEIDDAVQEVFLECFREGGVLARADPSNPAGFRPYLYGVARNVAMRVEARAARRPEREPPTGFDPDAVAGSEESLSRVFDRSWANSIVREAGEKMTARAARAGRAALRRVELVRLRFYEGLPIRDVARLWETDGAVLHREYARAREEFLEALKEVVAFHHPGTPGEVERECANLLSILKGR